MFPFRYSSIFRSRWMALFWAAGICWSAAEVAKHPPAGDPADGNAAVTNASGDGQDADQVRAAVAKLTG